MARTEPETPAAPSEFDLPEELLNAEVRPDPIYWQGFREGKAAALADRPAEPQAGAGIDVQTLRKALIDEGLLTETPPDSSEWGDAVPDREAENAYNDQVVTRIVARLASLPTDHNHDGGAHCFSDCPAYTGRFTEGAT